MLIDRVRDEMKEAMKSHDAPRVDALRFLLSEVKNVGINERRELDDAVVISVAEKLAKQRRDAIEQFRAAGRMDLVLKDERELGLLERYLPARASPEELEAKVRDVIQELGASEKKDMGRVMKAVLARLAGAADGKQVQAVVSRFLT
jgi:uncharacterized protein YqeY